jgi:CDP-diacylglycerol pyrophosphatase
MLGLALAVALASPALTADRDALWRIVNGSCVPAAAADQPPAPCQATDLEHGTVIIKDQVGVAQMLALPAARVTGMEDPMILAPDASAVWEAAWRARSLMEQRLGRPVSRDWVGLAVNSALARSQDQLHIHVDCLAPPVHEQLRSLVPGEDWRQAMVSGHAYWVRWIDGDDLSALNPIRLAADGPAGGDGGLGQWTVAVVGAVSADGRPGFHILASKAQPLIGNFAHSEEVLDHECRLGGGSTN